ncbi:MAG: SIS domain-containing protein [Simkaniaceae bacterium]
MIEEIKKSLAEGAAAVSQLLEDSGVFFIQRAAQVISDSLRGGNKVLIAGNGGSLCDAMHFAEELTGFFRGKRPALPAIALSDPGHMSCVANDVGFEEVFSRGVEAHGKPGDVLVLLTTSGNSQNLINAALAAKKRKLFTIAFLGKSGGLLKGVCDLELIVKDFLTSDRIQEAHMTAIHVLIEQIEALVFADVGVLTD